jgi:hypothetical protein
VSYDKRSYYFNNTTSKAISIVELCLSIPPGISNLFEIDERLTYEQIEYSVRSGTLKAAIQNGLCIPMPNPINHQRSISNDVLVRAAIPVQVMASRTRFATLQNDEPVIFNSSDDFDLFGDEETKPARLLEEEMKTSPENIEAIEATIKQANLPEKPVGDRYIPIITITPAEKTHIQQKIKNNMEMGYNTCEGTTLSGKQCMRRAKTGSKFCGHHKPA